MSFHAKVILGAGAVIAIAAALVFLLRSGEEDRIIEIVRLGAQRAAAKDADGVIALVDPEYSYEGQSYEQVGNLIRTTIRNGRVSGVDTDSVEATVEGEQATAFVRILLEEMGGRMPVRMEIYFRKRGDAWKVTGYEVKESGR